MNGETVISAYHDLWHVEKSFEMTKTELLVRPVFHRLKDSIEAHLTIVFAALAISRYLSDHTVASIEKIVNTLRPIRSAAGTLNGELLTLEPQVPPSARKLLTALNYAGN